MSDFLIDARFLFHNATESFWGASLIFADSSDNTFCFGFMRDLLRLRDALHINAGALIVGGDASSVAAENDIHAVVAQCRDLGIVVIEERGISSLTSLAAHAEQFSNIVTADRRALQLCSERRAIHLVKAPGSIERMTADAVQRSLGVPKEHVPTYLALTEGDKPEVAGSTVDHPAVTLREARRLVELHGALPRIYQHLPAMRSALRKKLAENRKIFEQRYRDNTVRRPDSSAELPRSLSWKLDGKQQQALFRERGFSSLIRMLPLADTATSRVGLANDVSGISKSYHAVRNSREFNELLDRIGRYRVIALDTEADDNDPRTALLLGISFSVAPGEASFVPFYERDMGDLTRSMVQRGLQKLFQGQTTFVGHHLKYDFALLQRNAVEPPSVCFDTLLAAQECYGDLDMVNLRFLAEKLLGRKIKAYRDIVPKGKTFLDLPFNEMSEHACCDADITLQLHAFLDKELTNRLIKQQFVERTMPRSRILLNLERDGVCIEGKRLRQLRSRLLADMRDLLRRVSDSVGTEVRLNSQDEISNFVREKLGLQEVLGRGPLTELLLEQLAFERPVLKWVVEYKRYEKRLRRIEAIIQAMRGGRVYPIINQTRDHAGRVSSTDPDLLSDDGVAGLKDCIKGEPSKWLRNAPRSLDMLQQASGDLALEADRHGADRVNHFMESQAGLEGIDHDDLLLRVAVWESSHRISSRFLLDRRTTIEIVNRLSNRYATAFRYLAEAVSRGSKRGYVEREGIRRYYDGFGSSSVEKRNTAKLLARRWLLDF